MLLVSNPRSDYDCQNWKRNPLVRLKNTSANVQAENPEEAFLSIDWDAFFGAQQVFAFSADGLEVS